MAIDKNKWADYVNLEWFWDRIRKRYDKKLDRVIPHNESILVEANNRVAVQISPESDNTLQLKTENGKKGLYVAPVKSLHRLIFGAREEFVYDGSEDVTVPVYQGKYD